MSPLPPQGLAASFVVPLIVISPMGYGEEKGWGTPLPPCVLAVEGASEKSFWGEDGRWKMEEWLQQPTIWISLRHAPATTSPAAPNV